MVEVGATDTPRQEHPLTYAAGLEHAVAYVGIAPAVLGARTSSRLLGATPVVTEVVVVIVEVVVVTTVTVVAYVL
jgi:fumarate reductase subunit C